MSTTPSGVGGASSSSGGLNLGGLLMGGAATLGLSLGVREVVQFGTQMAELETTVKRAGMAFEYVSGGSEEAAANLRAVKEASQGTIDTLTAQQVATSALNLGLAKNAEELSRVTTIARGVVAVSPVINDLNSAFAELSLTLSNMSWKRLDQLGLSVSEVKARYNQLRAENKGLSDEMAFSQAVLGVAEEKFGGLASNSEMAASGLEKLRIAWTEFRIEASQGQIGDVSNGFFGFLAEALDLSTAQLEEAAANQAKTQERLRADEYRRQKEYLDRLKAQRAEYGDAQGTDTSSIDAEIAALEKLAEEYVAVNRAKVAAYQRDEGIGELSEYVDDLNKNMFYTRPAAYDAGNGLNYLANLAWSTGSSVEELTGKLDVLRASLGYVSSAKSAALGQVQGQIEQALQMGLINPSQAAVALGGANERISSHYAGDGSGSLEERYQQMFELQQLGQQLGQPYEDMVETAKEAEREWKRAAKDVADDWADQLDAALHSVDGLFDKSEVTQDDLDAAKSGTYQEKADEYLRRLRDEVINGKDWEGVDIMDAAARAGIDSSLDPQAILKEFERQWDTSELFAGGANLDLINKDAVQAELDRQEKAKSGEQAIREFFGLPAEEAGNTIGIAAGQALIDTATTSDAAKALASVAPGAIGQDAPNMDMMSPINDAIAGLSLSEEQMAALRTFGDGIGGGIGAGLSEYDFAPPLSLSLSRLGAASISEETAESLLNFGRNIGGGIAPGLSEYDFAPPLSLALGGIASNMTKADTDSLMLLGGDIAQVVGFGIATANISNSMEMLANNTKAYYAELGVESAWYTLGGGLGLIVAQGLTDTADEWLDDLAEQLLALAYEKMSEDAEE